VEVNRLDPGSLHEVALVLEVASRSLARVDLRREAKAPMQTETLLLMVSIPLKRSCRQKRQN
jgi:hypothetical protein